MYENNIEEAIKKLVELSVAYYNSASNKVRDTYKEQGFYIIFEKYTELYNRIKNPTKDEIFRLQCDGDDLIELVYSKFCKCIKDN